MFILSKAFVPKRRRPCWKNYILGYIWHKSFTRTVKYAHILYTRMCVYVYTYAYMYMRIRVLGWCALRIYFGLDISELYVAAVLLGRAELLRTISCKSWLKELLIVAVLGLKPANLFDIHRWFSSIYSSAHSHIFKCRLAWLVSASFQPCFSLVSACLRLPTK